MFDLAFLVLLFLPLAFSTRRGRENLYPSEADPRGQIICDFGGGDLSYPHSLENLFFCAKPQYGGHSINLGGYCGYRLRPPQLTFDNSRWSWTTAESSNAYWQNYCQTRCVGLKHKRSRVYTKFV